MDRGGGKDGSRGRKRDRGGGKEGGERDQSREERGKEGSIEGGNEGQPLGGIEDMGIKGGGGIEGVDELWGEGACTLQLLDL